MDTLTQIALGAVAGHAVAGKKLGRSALVIGGLAGLLPDLDVVVTFQDDPLSSIIYHRHFSHALLATPIGAFLIAAPFFLFKGFKTHKAWVYWAAFAGYLTHGPLDWLTSYGTQLLLPFTNARYSLDWVSIVDPIYTSVLIVGIVMACIAGRATGASAEALAPRRARVSGIALVLSAAYLLFGGVQHFRAITVTHALASSRGHRIEHVRVMPTLANNILWRSVYRSGGVAYVDEIRVPWIGSAQYFVGGSIPLLERAEFSKIISDRVEPSGLAWAMRNFEVWNWFTDGFVTRAGLLQESSAISLSDQRYSPLPEGTVSQWGIELDHHGRVKRFGMRPPRSQTLKELWGRIAGSADRDYQSL